MFGLGQAVAALLSSAGYTLPISMLEAVGRVPIVVADSIVSTAKALGGEQLRVGLNVLIRCLAEARFPLHPSPVALLTAWNDALDRNLKDVNEDIRLGAAQAMGNLWSYYEDVGEESGRERLSEKLTFYKRMMADAMVEAERMGGALALGALTDSLASSSLNKDDPACVGKIVIDWLTESVGSRTEVDDFWAEARRDAVNAISAIFGLVGVERVDFHRVYSSLMAALDDYTTNNRGDIGRVLREAAMVAMGRLLTDAHRKGLIDEEAITTAVAKLIQQSCEKIDSTRRVCIYVIV